jgi:tRNA threonylcarbamoyladenosine biosynthesis protein TsaE
MSSEIKLNCNSLTDLQEIAAELIKKLNKPYRIALFGDLGAGKTTLVKTICDQIGVKDNVSSPTFSIVNTYENTQKVHHFDFYRIESTEEVFDLGYEEYFFDPNAHIFIEWPEKVESILPENFVRLYITLNKKAGRQFKLVY